MGLKIRRFTHVAEKLLTLAPHDVGRSVSMLDPFVKGLRLEEASSGVIATLTPFAQELECTDGRWHSLRILPYRTLDHSIKGVVIVLADIEVQRRARQVGEELAGYASKFLAIVSHPLAIIDGRMRVVWVNDAFYKAFQVVAEETIGDVFTKIGAGQWTDESLLRQIEGTMVTGAAFRDHLVRRVFPDVGPKTIRVSGSRLPPLGGDSGLVLLAFEEQAATVSR
jgi:two-component system CheB/CheR fusion protein